MVWRNFFQIWNSPLTEMTLPVNAGELQQFVCAANWMRASLPDFARHVKPLTDKLQKVLEGTKSTKMISFTKIIELTRRT